MTTREIAERLAAIVEEHYLPYLSPDRGGLVHALEGGLVELWVTDGQSARRPKKCGAPGQHGFNCTREAGHAGQHIALNGLGRFIESWPDPLAGENPGQAAAPAADESEAMEADEAKQCEARHPKELRAVWLRWFCTRAKSHAGDHVAHLSNGTIITRWPQEAPDAR